MQCPTCCADADILIDDRCYMCGDKAIREMIEELRPD